MPSAHRGDPPRWTPADAAIVAAKQALRAEVIAGRRRPESPSATLARTERALEACAGHRVVACYAARPTEPDCWALLRTLHTQGRTVLLPKLSRRTDASPRHGPDWAVFTGDDHLRPGLWGILEPDGPALGAGSLAQASLVWCTALAATIGGDRLGTGGGWYDLALTHADPAAELGVLLRDSEVVADVPVQSFDRPVHVIVTESRTIRVDRDR